MGARVIFHCLEELSRIIGNKYQPFVINDYSFLLEMQALQKKSTKKEKEHLKESAAETKQDPHGIIENIILIGAAVPSDILRFASLRVCYS